MAHPNVRVVLPIADIRDTSDQHGLKSNTRLLCIRREESVERRLAAIFAADVVGYSRLMGADEEDKNFHGDP